MSRITVWSTDNYFNVQDTKSIVQKPNGLFSDFLSFAKTRYVVTIHR